MSSKRAPERIEELRSCLVLLDYKIEKYEGLERERLAPPDPAADTAA